MKELKSMIEKLYKLEVEVVYPYTGSLKDEYVAECYSTSDISYLDDLTKGLNVRFRNPAGYRCPNQLLFKTHADFSVFKQRLTEKYNNEYRWRESILGEIDKICESSSDASNTVSGLIGLQGMFASNVKSPAADTLETRLQKYQTKNDTTLPTIALAFRRAANCGNKSDVEFFICHGGFDLEEKTSQGLTAEALAIKEGHQEIAKFIRAAIEQKQASSTEFACAREELKHLCIP